MPSSSADKANKIFLDRKGSCSQAIFAGYSEVLGFGKVDHDTSMKIASAFSGGISRTGNVCGALTGALMVIGLKHGGDKDVNKVNEVSVKLLDEFESIHGSTICRELIKQDLITDTDIKQAYDTGAFDNCSKFVDDVTVILDRLMFEES